MDYYFFEKGDLKKLLVRKGGIYNFQNNSHMDLRYVNKFANVFLNNFLDLENKYDKKYFDDYILSY